MNGSRVALDTNITIAILNREAQAMAAYRSAGRICLPSVVIGELLFGAVNSGMGAANLARYRQFIAAAELLPVDLAVSEQYAQLRLLLSRAGTPIPNNDLWIAATCLAHDLVLVTRDAHFSRCPGLATKDWLSPEANA
jgi:tRNA(fMet)-specific endonuclease VapC